MLTCTKPKNLEDILISDRELAILREFSKESEAVIFSDFSDVVVFDEKNKRVSPADDDIYSWLVSVQGPDSLSKASIPALCWVEKADE